MRYGEGRNTLKGRADLTLEGDNRLCKSSGKPKEEINGSSHDARMSNAKWEDEKDERMRMMMTDGGGKERSRSREADTRPHRDPMTQPHS